MGILTEQEIRVIAQLVDAGIKAVGIQVFQDEKTATALATGLNTLSTLNEVEAKGERDAQRSRSQGRPQRSTKSKPKETSNAD